MTNFDLLILAIYFICVAYVLYQAVNSIDAQFTLKLDQPFLDQQLQEQNLQNLMTIRFLLKKRYKLDDLRDLTLIAANKSDIYSIYLDWDYCSLTDFSGRSRRVVRIPSAGVSLGALSFQVFGIIAPNQTLQEQLTAEDILKKTESGGLAITGPLMDVGKLQKGSDIDRKRYVDFMAGKAPLHFVLRLALRLSKGNDDRRVYVQCRFIAEKLPWTDALPWNRRK